VKYRKMENDHMSNSVSSCQDLVGPEWDSNEAPKREESPQPVLGFLRGVVGFLLGVRFTQIII
jgi:hypothetical protein